MKSLTTFFEAFKKEHDVSRANVQGIVPLCDGLFETINTFIAPDYCNKRSTNEIYSEAKKFAVGFRPARLTINNYLGTALDSIDKLLFAAYCYTSTNKLICDASCSASGCEADLNQLQCDALTFFNGLPAAGATAINDLNGITGYVVTFYQQVRAFDKGNRLSCEPTGCKLPENLPNRVQTFFKMFEPLHTTSRTRLYKVKALCDQVDAGITEWLNRLAALSTKYCCT